MALLYPHFQNNKNNHLNFGLNQDSIPHCWFNPSLFGASIPTRRNTTWDATVGSAILAIFEIRHVSYISAIY